MSRVVEWGDPTEVPPAEIFDVATAMKYMRNDPQLLARLIDPFLKESAELLEGVRRALEANDNDELQRSAHKLKGTAALFGAHRTARAALELEQKGKRGEVASAAAASRRLEAELAALADAIRKRYEGGTLRES